MPAAILAIIELVTAAFSRIIASQLGRWVLQALLFFGISFVSNKVTTAAVEPALTAAFAGVGGDILAWMSYCNIDRALTIVLSAYATVAATRWTIKRASKGASS